MIAKTFRLFISSPFSDFEKEREVLHKKVFPEIEKYCNKYNLTFQPIDLRWGVNEEAQLDQKTLDVCLEEVRACKHFPHPNFLIMAGDRYGYVPLPYMIEESEFQYILKYIENNNKKIVIKFDQELDSDKEVKSQKASCTTTQLELLESWYALDTNQIYLTDDNTSTAYILQVREDDYEIYVNWQAEENALRDILQEAANHIFKSEKDKEYQKYFLSATEQEVLEGICDFKDKTKSQKNCDGDIDKKYIFGYTRTIIGANDKYIDIDTKEISGSRVIAKSKDLQRMADNFKENLKNTLDKDNICPAKASSFDSIEDYEKSELKEFKEYIVEKLINAIDEQVNEHGEISELKQEKLEQEKFLQDKVKGFQGREKTLTAIDNYIKIDSTEALIIHGPSGMGKSSLMAKAIESAKTDSKIFRFVGATANSITIRKLLMSIVDEFQDMKIIETVDEYEVNESKFDTQIKDIFTSIKKETTIFIDALDQLQHINYLNWLPDVLPTNLKIILSVLNDREKYKEDTHYYNHLKTRYNKKNNFIDITEDSLEERKDTLVEELLKVEHRKLNQVQIDHLLKNWAETHYSPLYLKIAIEEVKHWKNCNDKDDNPILCEKQKLNKGIDGEDGIILEYLKNLISYYHHEELLIKKVFGYIYSSKDGLSERELLQILSEDLEDDEDFREAIINEYHKAIKVSNPRRDAKEEHILPISIWSRLHTQIKPFIIERNIDGQLLMKFFHREFTSVVEKYIGNEKTKLHTKLADYFFTLQNTPKTWDERYYNLHMLDELPYQLFHTKNSEKLKDILFDLEFAGSVYNNHKQNGFREILEIAIELDDILHEEIYPWESFYREKEHLINKIDEEQWRPHQSLFQLAYEDGEYSQLSINAKKLLYENKVNFFWLQNKQHISRLNRIGLIKVIKANRTSITLVAELKNRNIVSADRNGNLVISTIDGKELISFLAHKQRIKKIIVLDSGNILSYDWGGSISIWSEGGKALEFCQIHNGIKEVIELSNGNILSYGSDSIIKIWDISGNILFIFLEHDEPLEGVIELKNGNILSYDSYDVYIWDLRGEISDVYINKSEGIIGVIELNNSNILIYGGKGLAQVYTPTGNNITYFDEHDGTVGGAIELNSRTIASYDDEGNIRIWNQDGITLIHCKESQDQIAGIIELNNGDILSYTQKGTIRIWHAGKNIFIYNMRIRIEKIKSLKNGSLLLSTAVELCILGSNGKIIALFDIQKYSINGIIELSNNNILSYGSKGGIRIWNINEESLTLPVESSIKIKGSFVFDDRSIVIYSSNGSMKLWSSKGKELVVFVGHQGTVKGLIRLYNGNILSYDWDNVIKIWSLNGKNLKTFKKSKKSISDVMELKNRDILLIESNSIIRILNKEGNERYVLEGHEMIISGVIELRSGNILSYDWHGIFKIWDKNGNNLMTSEVHTANRVIEAIELTNGNIISYCAAGFIKVWNIEKQKIYTFKAHEGALINGVIELYNGNILSYDGKGTIKVWIPFEGELMTFEEYYGITKIVELSNGNILSYDKNGVLKIWNLYGTQLFMFYVSNDNIELVDLHEDCLITIEGKYDFFSETQKISFNDLLISRYDSNDYVFKSEI